LEAAAPVDRATVEEHRLALSDALGLGTGAPWDAIRDRVTELALPPLGQDPVARRLGLVAEHRATVLNEAADALDGLTQETAAADMTMPEGRWRAGLDAGIRELRRLANEERDEREAQVHLDQLVEDVCRPVVIGGEIVRVHGAAEMSDESRAALAEVTAIVKRRMAVEAQQQTETPPSIHANDVEGFCPACGHPTLRVGEDGLLTCTLMDCPNPDAANGLSYRLEAVLTERFTELGNPFSRMRIAFQGPDSWPASREVGPHDVAEVLRELQAAAVPAGTGEVPCPGFPDGCPTLIAVVPTVGSTHGGGLRCGCYDEKSTP
jgi:hypothetical protein